MINVAETLVLAECDCNVAYPVIPPVFYKLKFEGGVGRGGVILMM